MRSDDYWPTDTENEIYLPSSSNHSLSAILNLCKEKWPDANMNDLMIQSSHIQTYCIGYDRYDPIDYTDFIVIRRVS